MSRLLRRLALATLAVASLAPELLAQRGAPVRRPISIGHHPRVDGIRINYRDKELELVRGANITVWSPYDGYLSGRVVGAAIGLPITMAGDIHGVGVGVFGVGAEDDFRGIGLGGIGLGAGGSLRGLMLGGVGVGAGGSVRGAAVGGLGVGAGGDARGLMVGGLGAAAGGSIRGIAVAGLGAGAGGSVRGLTAAGLGAGAGGDIRGMTVAGLGAGAGGEIRGITVGGLGVGAGGRLRGISVAGLGVGAGGSIRGISVGGLGVGAGDDVTGVTVGGLGVGSGGTLRWVTLGGLGVGAPRIEGVASALLVGAERTHGMVVAPALFRTERGGQMTGASISTVNAVRGMQQGLTIGLVNYTERLRGVQVGAINIVADRPWPWKVLPVVNVGRE
ncbi:MAG: hypothetical protein KF689_00460 [Gemmatimonadaceae bacterium]|nr:hypothetical protein [Gemmatimonadaceae bacterium]MCW5826399.1 hypothetical protein [Gemmatimonadaceae bacterium]